MKNYLDSILLLLGLVAGTLVGLYLPTIVPYLQPIGVLFLNAVFILVVPMIVCAVVLGLYGIRGHGTWGGVWKLIVIYMGVAVLLTTITYWVYGFTCRGLPLANPLGGFATGEPLQGNHSQLLSPPLVPIILCALCVGLVMSPTRGRVLRLLLVDLQGLVTRLMNILFKVAPIGIGCYFAGVVQSLGTTLISTYVNILLTYLGITVGVYFIIYPILYLCTGSLRRGSPSVNPKGGFCRGSLSVNPKGGFAKGKPLQSFFRAILPPTILAIATSSSAACIPTSIQASKQLGTSSELADAVIPIGTMVYKHGSMIANVFKVLVAMSLLGLEPNIFIVIGIAIVASVVVGAVPTGGLTGEMMVLALLGTGNEHIAVLVGIATLVDIPATLLNTIGNVVIPTTMK